MMVPLLLLAVAFSSASSALASGNGIAEGAFVPTQTTPSRLPTRIAAKVLSSRREALRTSFAFVLAANAPTPADAEEGKTATAVRPYAPLESLLPAVRARRVVDRAAEVARELVEFDTSNAVHHDDLTRELESLILARHNFTASAPAAVPSRPAQQYIDSYRQRREELPPIARPGAFLVQSGEVRAWARLKRQEADREADDEFRAAFNVYVSDLRFDGDSYILTAPREVRSKLIREDRLPDVKTVIASDMGMRYLYRNEVLTALDDARAELQYQLGQQCQLGQIEGGGKHDMSELLELLRGAQRGFDRWFSLVDANDVQQALNAVEREVNNGSEQTY